MTKPLFMWSESCLPSCLLICILVVFGGCRDKKEAALQEGTMDSFLTPLGKKYTIAEPAEEMLAQFNEAEERYRLHPDKAENTIWYGRRAAYLGQYEEAIRIFSEGIEKFPTDARFYRHRGHRYITLRKFGQAVKDLEKAAKLIEGTADSIEPDGIPNAQNIPVSTLHSNIWYHLGLAYYVQHNYPAAYKAFIRCRAAVSNADNLVSSTHWLYMIQRRMGNAEEAANVLGLIPPPTPVIENQSYEKLCEFYKGLIPIDSLLPGEMAAAASDAVSYGIANWYFYSEDKETSETLLREIVAGDAWNSFGYIAAESDLIRYFNPL